MTCPKCRSTMLQHIVLQPNSPSAQGISCYICGYWVNGPPQEQFLPHISPQYQTEQVAAP